jgi:hypothetical protein
MMESTAAILNEFSNSNKKISSNNNNTSDSIIPSFDQFCEKPPPPPPQQSKEQQHRTSINVRIHPTEMQRYLRNLIKGNESMTASDMNKDDRPSSQKESMNNIPTCLDANGNNNVVTSNYGIFKLPSRKRGDECNTSFCSETSSSNFQDGYGGVASPNSITNSTSNTITSLSKRSKNSTGLQKNDKAVDVLNENSVIARFSTQTECAKFLRATPEAVSYHCSKGGGVCNGLVIRPADKNNTTFGLFDGAEQYRPKERPQLNKEAVEILKDWLLSPEHVDNPYPNQSESKMLMEQTGLDKTQLKHWFNNARKRILKPFLKKADYPPSDRRKMASSRAAKKEPSSVAHSRSSSFKDPSPLSFQGVNSANFSQASLARCGHPIFDDGCSLQRRSPGPAMCFGTNEGGMNAGNNFGGSTIGGMGMGFGAFGSNDQGGQQHSFSNNGFSAFCQQLPSSSQQVGANHDDLLPPHLEEIRLNAVFKQQVATMAMTEAGSAFKEMEDAYAFAKEVVKRSTTSNPEDDPIVVEANAVAKKCHGTAMFKLKVSQRANEEAGNSYTMFRQLTDGMGLNMGGGSSMNF